MITSGRSKRLFFDKNTRWGRWIWPSRDAVGSIFARAVRGGCWHRVAPYTGCCLCVCATVIGCVLTPRHIFYLSFIAGSLEGSCKFSSRTWLLLRCHRVHCRAPAAAAAAAAPAPAAAAAASETPTRAALGTAARRACHGRRCHGAAAARSVAAARVAAAAPWSRVTRPTPRCALAFVLFDPGWSD
jgi:hypothetical protein